MTSRVEKQEYVCYNCTIGEDNGDVMNHKIDILNLRINDYTAKESMKKIVQFMQTEPVSVVELLTADTLVKLEENEELLEYIGQSDMVLPCEKYVMEIADIEDKKKVQEVENRLFLKMFLRYLHKNHARVFLLSETEEECELLKEQLADAYRGIRIAGSMSVPAQELVDDLVINNINSIEPDCVISIVQSPVQEAFISRSRTLLNARLWLGAGKVTVLFPKMKETGRSIKKYLQKFILKREAEREKQKKRENA